MEFISTVKLCVWRWHFVLDFVMPADHRAYLCTFVMQFVTAECTIVEYHSEDCLCIQFFLKPTEGNGQIQALWT